MFNPTDLSTQNRLRESYLTLGLTPTASWSEIKAAYRRLVQKNHPDRFTEGTTEHQRALNNFLALQQAYEQLAAYQEAIQEVVITSPTLLKSDLPPLVKNTTKASLKPSAYTTDNTTNTGHRPQKNHIPIRSERRSMRLKKRWLLLGMIILIMGYGFNKLILVDDDSLNNIPTSVSSAADTKSEHPLTPDYANFGVGDDMQTVLSSQGQPTHIEGNVWLYGESKVVFAQGKVIDWQSHAKDPLKTR